MRYSPSSRFWSAPSSGSGARSTCLSSGASEAVTGVASCGSAVSATQQVRRSGRHPACSPCRRSSLRPAPNPESAASLLPARQSACPARLLPSPARSQSALSARHFRLGVPEPDRLRLGRSRSAARLGNGSRRIRQDDRQVAGALQNAVGAALSAGANPLEARAAVGQDVLDFQLFDPGAPPVLGVRGSGDDALS